MKRRATKVILFLLMGAIINIAVAWSCPRLSIRAGMDIGLRSQYSYNAQGRLVGIGSFAVLESAGLPLRSLRNNGNALIEPIWPGFAINTIFYAAILWLPFAALGAFRRRRRIKRGLCARCGYPVSASGSAVCSECGTAVHGAAAPLRRQVATATCNPSRKQPTAESPQ